MATLTHPLSKAPVPVRTGETNNSLSELGEKIFLDRYALKDMGKSALEVGDLVIVCTDESTGQREIGTVASITPAAGATPEKVSVDLRNGGAVEVLREHIARPIETEPKQMMDRIARGIAAVEGDCASEWYDRFRWLMDGWKFIPAGRILTGAGSDQNLTYYNCYVIPCPKDSRRGIVETLSQLMEIMSRGGGVGVNVSSLRPRHSYVKGVNGRSSGSVSWGALYSFVTGLIEQGGSRRGALMLILNCWHPDVLEFINSKRDMGKITNANISVGITDDFMRAVEKDADWDLVFPDNSDPTYEASWDGNLQKWVADGKRVIAYKTVKAREVWNQVIESAWSSAEPGVFFIDRANSASNSWYYDRGYLGCTNPCGEQPLPGFAVCNLGAINLSKFTKAGDVKWEELGTTVEYAVRFLDDVIDATPYFFEENHLQQTSERRIGLNTMGLAEMMIDLGIRYGSDESLKFIDKLYAFIAARAYTASAAIAEEKGPFPLFDPDKFLQSGFMKAMPHNVRQTVREKGVRNVTLLTQAPNGTIGTMMGTSTGIEPFYSWVYNRMSRLGNHTERVGVVEQWYEANPGRELPEYFVTAMDLTPAEHIGVQAAVQRWMDSSISKTCNLPAEYSVDQTRQIYELLYATGCKGGTIYRDGSRDIQVLTKTDKPKAAPAAEDQPKVRALPARRTGATVSMRTPAGTAHITMNRDDERQPFEVFVEIGKAGSDLKAMAEALGRTLSLMLRIESPMDPLERVHEVATQLQGIGGARSLGFGPTRILSLPDAVGNALLAEFFPGEFAGNGHHQPAAKPSPGRQVHGDLCPRCGDTAFIRVEGCQTCQSCGHSEC
jgi:ribonucleoside-diphosphate reductase alpha chain